MPSTKTAPHKAARRIARKRLRESAGQLAGTNGDGNTGVPAGVIDSHDIKDYAYSLNEIEQFCVGCGRTVSPMPVYRVTRRDGRLYCRECAERPLPTTTDMLAVVERAFEIIAATARRGEEGSLGEAVARYAQDGLRPELAGLDWDQWEYLADIWEHLAYRPLQTA